MAYTTIKEIGRGSFGVVELVVDDDGVRWAKKTFVPPNLPGIRNDDMRRRFEREVRYQSEIDSPNVVRIHDYDLDGDPPWFIMELANCSLADELTTDRTLGGDPRKPLFDILAGLESIHQKGYKHRDLKPANVLKFSNEFGGGSRYAISDFGLMSPATGQTSTLTASNMGGGTVLYRAPECAISFKRATVQSDIYSVGAVLHDIFGGGASRVPHTELTVAGDLGPIVQKCTKTNVRRRYADVATLREKLFEVLRDKISFSSREEEEIVKLLQSNDHLSDQEWDRVFQQIDENEEKKQSNHPIFSALTIAQLEQLATEAPDLFASLGKDYAKYTYGVFNFDYCDVIASRAEVFYKHGELDLKALIALALLHLGTSHNRWFVERKFVQMTRPSISDELAQRIAAEIDVQKYDFPNAIRHLERSIGVNHKDLHPILAKKAEGS